MGDVSVPTPPELLAGPALAPTPVEGSRYRVSIRAAIDDNLDIVQFLPRTAIRDAVC
jgi:hypothetical protein